MTISIYDSLSTDALAAADSLAAMMQKEQTAYKCRDFLLQPKYQDDNIVTESDRLKIVDWCYSIIDHLEFGRETVTIAVELMDRFLSKQSATARHALNNRSEYQLLAMSALYLAIKTNEQVAIGSDFFASMSRGAYTIEDIESMEVQLLRGLEWRICAPTSIQMAYHILSIVLPSLNLQESVTAFILDEVRFQTEFSLRDYYFTTKRPSTVAVAAIFNSLDSIGEQDRQAILEALLSSVMNDEFDSIEDLISTRNRLQFIVQGNARMVPSESSTDVRLLNEGRGQCCGGQKSPAALQRTASPQSVAACCRRDNVLCENCLSR